VVISLLLLIGYADLPWSTFIEACCILLRRPIQERPFVPSLHCIELLPIKYVKPWSHSTGFTNLSLNSVHASSVQVCCGVSPSSRNLMAFGCRSCQIGSNLPMGGLVIAAVGERVGWRSIIIVRCASGSQECLSNSDATGAYNKVWLHPGRLSAACCMPIEEFWYPGGTVEVRSLRSRFPLTRWWCSSIWSGCGSNECWGTFVGVA
jgi:hypothetical protein